MVYLMLAIDAVKPNTRLDQPIRQNSFWSETRLAASFDGGHS